MKKIREITYTFKFENEESLQFKIELNESGILINNKQSESTKDWTKLDHHKCKNCPLNSSEYSHCPVAINLNEVVEETKDKISHVRADIYVQTPERVYVKKTDTQEGLLSLFGLVMASSNCPHLDWFRPMARFHLPFSTVEETMFRVLSLQLMKQYFQQHGEEEYSLDELKKHYKEVETLNLDFIERIRSYCKGDADANAVAALDLFAKLFEFELEADFSSLKVFFEKESQ